MVRGISTFTNLPTPLKAGLIIASGGGSLAALRYLFPGAFWYVLIGLALVAVSLLLYWRLLKWMKKRKAAPMEQDLLKSSSATPQGISEPANVAKLDDLRKKFEEGTRKFQSAGKSLYSFPWYVIVGEPGSGKTEAIRHCNVGFPPGLQDEFQGTGGTINMNWWFTDHAVILDTAGRLMFEEVETGGSKEWREFLNLMKRYRPRCPINGVLLVIPADSLIKDTADQIEQKASKIARQFDVIQRTLDVRFPVFVVVTKSDLINGFRDFFDNLQDPQLQHQMLGWSNPAPLDEPYNPDFVDQHLKAIQGRLFRRRLALLHEVMSESEEPGAEKVRTADTLYAFPQSLTKIAPRMARYLELIFSVGSKWSCKPLFFRGIYFTSSMREGSALDEELAESLGVPVDSLPDGRVWERDRAYFLRDLFVKKIFREQGLVTYATNAKSLHRRRKTAVLVTAAVSVIVLLFLTILAYRDFNRSIGEIQKYFVGLAELMPRGDTNGQNKLEVLTEKIIGEDRYFYEYSGHREIPIASNVQRYNVSAELAGAVRRWQEKGKPWIFAPAAIVADSITSQKLNKAQTALYDVSVLQPFVNASRNLMIKQENGEWTLEKPGTRTLRQLIRLKANMPLKDKDEYSARAFLNPFLEYVIRHDMGDEDDIKARSTQYEEHKVLLHEPLNIIYNEDWPPAFLKTHPNEPEPSIEHGVELFNEYWTDPNRLSERSQGYAHVQTIGKLVKALKDFNDAEENLFALRDQFSLESAGKYRVEKIEELKTSWDESFINLKEANDIAVSFGDLLGSDITLEKLWNTTTDAVLEEVHSNYNFLLNEVNEVQEKHFLGNLRRKLETTLNEIEKEYGKVEFAEQLKSLDKRFYAKPKGKRRLYEIRFEMYSTANEQLAAIDGMSNLSEVDRAIKDVGEAVTKAHLQVDQLFSSDRNAFHFPQASEISRLAISLAERKRLYHIVNVGLEPVAAPKTIDQLKTLVEEKAGWDWKDIPQKAIDKKYDPNSAIAVLDGWRSLGEALMKKLPQEKDLLNAYKKANGIYTEYESQYLRHWLEVVPDFWIKSKIPYENSWKEQRVQLGSLSVSMEFSKLDRICRTIEKEILDKFESDTKDSNERVKYFRENVKKLRDDFFLKQCGITLGNWVGLGDLGDDAFEVRNILLKKKLTELKTDYFPFHTIAVSQEGFVGLVGLVDLYWLKLTQVSLKIVADEIQREGGKALKDLRTGYGDKFPLARDSEQDLTIPQFGEAQSLLRQVLLEEYPPVEIGRGPDFVEINELLKKLSEPPVDTSSKKWIVGIKKVIHGLPVGGNVYYCRISVLNENDQRKLLREGEQYLPVNRSYCELFQDGQGNGLARIRNLGEENKLLGTVKYPHDGPIRLLFYTGTGEGDDKPITLEFPKPWACLRMLHKFSEPDKGEGYIKLKKKELPGVIWLKLDFCKKSDGNEAISFPKINDWPSSKK